MAAERTAADPWSVAPSVTPVHDVIAGRYELGRELGHGGMAQVRAAVDLRLRRQVAVKLLDGRVAPDPAARLRFVREARAAASFTHPHAVAVFDAGDADGFLYLVMELVEGRPLADRIAAGPLAVDEAVRIVDEVLQALGAAHRAGIVHRDVKPGNVLLASDGFVKLADFGIAKRTGDRDLTLAGQFIGTPEYLAPEQVDGRPVTPATDLYAAGVVLFEALAGSPPFAAGSPLATALAHRDAPVPDLRRRRGDVPEHVVRAVARAMEKEPAARFATAEQMRAALAGRVVAVPPPPAVVPSSPVTPSTAVMPRRATRAWWWLAVATAAAVAGTVIALDAVGGPGRGGVLDDRGHGPRDDHHRADDRCPDHDHARRRRLPRPHRRPCRLTVPTPASLDDLLLLVDVAPIVFGRARRRCRRGLERIADRGRERDVERLLEQVAAWREEGSLPAATAAIIEAALSDVPVDGTGDEGGDD